MAGKVERKPIVLRDIRLMFRNFSGEARRYNNAGDRNFNAAVSKEQAEMLTSIGFNVRELEPRDDFTEPLYLLKVKVSYRFNPPNVKLSTSRVTRELNEETVGDLDRVSIEHCDISIMPSEWSQPNGDSGVSAYLWSMRAKMLEDPLDEFYPEEDEEPF